MFTETADIETASDDYASRFSGRIGAYFLEQQTRITLSFLADMRGARVLDVGGGHGQLAVPLVQQGYGLTVTGSDDCCRQRLDHSLPAGSFEYQTCDSLCLPFDDQSFEVVMAFRLLPHVEQWRALLAEMCRVANRCVILDYPDPRSFNILYRYLFNLKKKMEGNTRTFTLFTRQQIQAEMVAAGFGKPQFRPEFLLPMVVYRKANSRFFASLTEKVFRISGLTGLFGSPVIFRADRLG